MANIDIRNVIKHKSRGNEFKQFVATLFGFYLCGK